MAVQYTDVDVMLLNRWDEVTALQEAFDELLERMTGVIETALQRVAGNLKERGFRVEWDARRPSLAFWKPDWENRKKDAGLYAILSDFVPAPYGKNIEEHPVLWLITEDFASLRTLENSDSFGRALRLALSPEQRERWNHAEFELSRSPVGREWADVSERERVALVADVDKLVGFLSARFDDFMELVPVIDVTLGQMTRK